jgi:biotin carboxyl carrier protein
MTDPTSPTSHEDAKRAERAAERAERAARRVARHLEMGVLSQMSGFVTAAFGLVAALAWNAAIQAAFDAYVRAGDTVTAKLVYAVVVSLVAVLVVLWIGALTTRAKARLAEHP